MKEHTRQVGPLPREFDPVLAKPLAVDEDDDAAMDAGAAEQLPAAVERGASTSRRIWRKLLVLSVVALLAIALGFDLADLLARAWLIDPWFGGGIAALIVTGAAGLLGLAGAELAALRRIERVDHLRLRAARGDTSLGQAVAALYRGRADLAPAVAELDRQVSDAHDAAEAIRLTQRVLLHPLDRRAYRLVLAAARDTALATALSPAALLDALIVAWRNLRLVRQIASLYGARPGWLGSIRLLRRMLANLAVAGVAEGGTDLAVEAVGGTVAAAMSARVGQGLLNGMLTARVGIVAMHMCRPLPFAPEDRPGLRRIRQELLGLPRMML
ncbi:MAG TPA: TIGR01620 family protein [Arenibaculum sp.]|nr:TIGR01620 family protein [Arenibaculum sp.]